MGSLQACALVLCSVLCAAPYAPKFSSGGSIGGHGFVMSVNQILGSSGHVRAEAVTHTEGESVILRGEGRCSIQGFATLLSRHFTCVHHLSQSM
jgi:hypothetical protein